MGGFRQFEVLLERRGRVRQKHALLFPGRPGEVGPDAARERLRPGRHIHDVVQPLVGCGRTPPGHHPDAGRDHVEQQNDREEFGADAGKDAHR